MTKLRGFAVKLYGKNKEASRWHDNPPPAIGVWVEEIEPPPDAGPSFVRFNVCGIRIGDDLYWTTDVTRIGLLAKMFYRAELALKDKPMPPVESWDLKSRASKVRRGGGREYGNPRWRQSWGQEP